MVALLPRREWSRNEAEEVAAILKNLPLMLALSHHWEIRIPNPPDLPYLDTVVFDDPNCPQLGITFRDHRSSQVAAERWVLLIRRILYWLSEVPSGQRLAQQLTAVLNLLEKRFALPQMDWNTLVIEQPPINPDLRREWQEKLRRAGNEGLLPQHHTEEELRQLQRKEEDIRRVTMKKAQEQAEAAKSPPRDNSVPQDNSALRANPALRAPSSTAEAEDETMLTLGWTPMRTGHCWAHP